MANAVRRELLDLGQLDSALGAGALVLAARLDDPGTASTALPAYQRELRETMAALRRARAGSEDDPMSEFERRARERDEQQRAAP